MRRRALFAVISQRVNEFQDILLATTGRKIWRLKESDMYRLHRLWVWSIRYKVPLTYIIPALLEYFIKGVEKRTGKRSKGLGCSIATLTGTVAEEVLQKRIEKDFPENEHLSMWREVESDRIYSLIDEDGIPTRVKSILDYPSLNAATKAMIGSIRSKRERYEKIANKLSKVPYRDNPFIQ